MWRPVMSCLSSLRPTIMFIVWENRNARPFFPYDIYRKHFRLLHNCFRPSHRFTADKNGLIHTIIKLENRGQNQDPSIEHNSQHNHLTCSLSFSWILFKFHSYCPPYHSNQSVSKCHCKEQSYSLFYHVSIIDVSIGIQIKPI